MSRGFASSAVPLASVNELESASSNATTRPRLPNTTEIGHRAVDPYERLFRAGVTPPASPGAYRGDGVSCAATIRHFPFLRIHVSVHNAAPFFPSAVSQESVP
jgi:hypothetical protein